MIFLGLKFWPKVSFFGLRKRTKGFFWVCKKSSDFFGWTNSEVVISLGIKYEPLSDPPPPVIKVCEWGPWDLHKNQA